MKRTVRFMLVLALLLGAMAISQSATTGACDPITPAGSLDCPS